LTGVLALAGEGDEGLERGRGDAGDLPIEPPGDLLGLVLLALHEAHEKTSNLALAAAILSGTEGLVPAG